MSIHIYDVSFLWERNENRTWIKHLLACYHSKVGRDYETIAFWRSQFNLAAETTLTCDRDFVITDGHHRLIAAWLSGLESISVRVCPQKTTYR